MSILTTQREIGITIESQALTAKVEADTRFCVGCAHHVFSGANLGHLCYVRGLIALVTAELVPDNCTAMRGTYGACGLDGRLYEPK